ncbi:protease modulator HflC [Methylobacterium sp. Leaf102]|jgi:membrane protease subunit HflC|uniref:protease modulator HflC n=1 Tax=unclassified Methylobacterium TaxID=2615210 RepID=UPI0006F82AD1|nr:MULTISPECIES: protease modulator HflC [unclassified Methylobacterium]USU32552.1 protease modulator HflC [Methylobacterium sp. OTU13CASTA1]KQO55286.1 protease modulator HflC [Methylobacterium sp. Leaf87]KQP17406.1 protease modulator HflC [Methylobacterium sp. Leaf100]KQP22233.1 protease modulator HflC [Methylobacterium sp. Leaf102]KQP59378.1 protease modulator HflC [Methylobacterium sp. Leaf112]
MNNPAIRTGLMIAAAAVFVLLYASVFTVGQMQQALVLQFGRVRAVLNQTGTDKPGLYFKVPFFDNVVLFDKRVLDLDLPVQTLLTADRQNLEVDAFARYRIIDPLKFYQSANNILRANTLLASFTNSALRNVLARSTRDAIVRTQRSDLMNQIQGDVNRQAKELGVEIVDLRMTRVDLPAQNSTAVYRRMTTERNREAADIRANGDQIAATIKAKADRDVTVLISEANQTSETLRGQGDADKNRILAAAYGKDADFFSFYRSMQAYETGLKGSDTRLVISPSSDFFRYFSDPQGRSPATAARGATDAGATGSVGR